jgi:lipoprotein-anchoring transpeptidase ErfK/SrfK
MHASGNTAGGARGAAAWRRVTALALIGALLLTAGCSGDGDGALWQGGGGGGGGGGGANAEPAPKGPVLSATVVTPTSDAKGVKPLAAVAFTTQEAKGAPTVKLTDAKGKPVKGKLSTDGKRWLPSEALKWGTTYVATVTVRGDDGETATTTSRFTVMAKPGKLVQVSSQLGDDSVVGVAMPLIVRFGRSVPKKQRDDVQRRMRVTSTPPQEGIWRWVSGSEVHYRPKVYWKAGTRISFKVAARGVPMGGGWYGRSDLTVRAKVGSATVMTVDNRSKQMTVKRNGKVLRRIPISLGKAKTPSSSGTMVVMEKVRNTVFDTIDELGPVEGYRTPVEFAQRLTWGGEFIHAAPWSVGAQGRTNVSHGCVNMSTPNAAWLFGITKMGDPVVIKGTGRQLDNGNGWTDWNMSWSQYVKGSAIPYDG